MVHPDNTKFVKMFKETYGTLPDTFGGVYYVATWMAYEVIEYAGSSSPSAIKKAFREMSDRGLFYGPVTILKEHPRFTPEGFLEDYYTIAVQWINGKMITVGPAERASTRPIWPVNATVFGKYVPNWPTPTPP